MLYFQAGDDMIERLNSPKVKAAEGEERVKFLKEVAALYTAGYTTTQLSWKYRKSSATISNWLNTAQKMGLMQRRPRGRPRKRRKEVAV